MKADIFKNGSEQTIADVLRNKDQRAALQQQLLQQYPDDTIVAVKLNIPGPIKTNDKIVKLFKAGIKQIETILQANGKLLKKIQQNQPTGPENFYVFQLSGMQVKQLASEFEDHNLLGRLFDIDVMDAKNAHYSRKQLNWPSRKCFICNRDAKECGRNRTHSVAELQAYVNQVYNEVFSDEG
ncbi:hypothetical protein AYR59_01600 [Fructilactobacillus lindneri]|uniref:citrate lyase holo-[acyl-carrier protein] synthase n=3 Tax=Fructilactobacillus lindneri TaxID=53444 RepID=A0A0R2JVL2_9LACO|nr:citrate lyase holo-[acyl-carrier protein] synthase [Fructilactobacillus lindneri]ANZ57561.1 hypothetical protein AYR60_01600 [Fructilactobacillus lindneri]ANZ58830.1 hypothetical protein AYR59_01600 [Fructilactobacillus lindneri]KRN78253.1 apo-citrate lyase phosphoribosyl-ft dephospho-CoA transferase [Fructilactobacillus lindneri DSM 20690 = JCM 11027]SJZ95118.1 holo-ACP synthase [Fructilactobacillus lindneri DSM 20690 = JCM 11027]